MFITKRFNDTIRIAFFLSLLLFIFSFILDYLGMSGISISHPEENTTTRIVLNKIMVIFYSATFWLLIGYLLKDMKSAGIALASSLALHFGLDYLLPDNVYNRNSFNLNYFILSFSYAIPYIVFGMIHFSSEKITKSFKLLGVWAIFFGVSIATYTGAFEAMIEGLARPLGIRDIFEVHIPKENGGYSIANWFRPFKSNLFIIWRITIFWWVYQYLESKFSKNNALMECFDTTSLDRVSFSAIYWSFRILLFAAGLGLAMSLGQSFRDSFDPIYLLRVIFALFGIVVSASVYRNFLVSHLASRDHYPGGLYFMLNIPVINVFAWISAVLQFYNKNDFGTKASTASDQFKALQERFVNSGKNPEWKILIIVLAVIGIIFQLGSSGLFRSYGGGSDTTFFVMLTGFFALAFLIWFMYSKEAFLVLLILSCLGILITALIKNQAILVPSMGAALVNLVLYYGLFHFDQLKWAEVNTAFSERKDDDELSGFMLLEEDD